VPARTVDPRRIAIYRRRRAVAVAFVLLVVAAILALTFVGGRATADGSAPGEIRPAAVYVVRPGDTLWDLAVALAPDRDPRVVVAALERAAGGATVHPGQRIVLPASLQQ
jgi:Tfp pilus assembly protein FimV